MLAQLRAFIENEALFEGSDRLLLAISGGIDSMVLAHLLNAGGWKVGLAHCNFQLRGEASLQDEIFVADTAKNLGVPFFSIQFDTFAASQTLNTSIQLAARQLRYDWLEKVREENGFQWILTAHHLNDCIETLLLNITRGCGLRGLHGIPVRNGKIVRPLLFATRDEITQYAIDHGIEYREDASNAADYYARNRIRHQIIPGLKDLNPSLERTMEDNFLRFQQTEGLFIERVNQLRAELVQDTERGFTILLDTLKKHPAALTLLFEWLHPWGFNMSQLKQALASAHQSGAIFETASHRMLIDRALLVVEKKQHLDPNEIILVGEETAIDFTGGRLLLSFHPGKPGHFEEDPAMAYLDANALVFPLKLRRWRPGDWFFPLGMRGKKKKLQDFFTDEKLTRFEKEQIWLLETGDEQIAWVVGYRIDDRYKIKADTPKYLLLQFLRS